MSQATASHKSLLVATLILVAATASSATPIRDTAIQPFDAATAAAEDFEGEGPLEDADDETMSPAAVVTFLKTFGYLKSTTNNNNNTEAAFSVDMTEALKQMQSYAGIEATGKMNAATRRVMKTPRCGLSDQVASGDLEKRNSRRNRKWNTLNLNYRIFNYPTKSFNLKDRVIVRREIAKAFNDWSSVSGFKFNRRSSGPNHISLSFFSKKHDDIYPFDGTGKVLAHAFFPPDGRVHFDDDEAWSVYRRGADLRQVLTHELGHTLGLSHSKDRDAVMYAYFRYRPDFKLTHEDIRRIRSLYAFNRPATSQPNNRWWWGWWRVSRT